MGYFSKKDNSLVFTGNGEVVELRPWGKNSFRTRASFFGGIKEGEIAESDGFFLDTYNIVLGGCSLSMHYENMTGNVKAYAFHKNAKAIASEATLNDALLSGNYDVITLQQVSHLANNYETYTPLGQPLLAKRGICLCYRRYP